MATLSLLSAAARRLDGKVALITGAASGIGEATARVFAKHGAKLILVDIQDDLGNSLSQDLTSASYLRCDVTNEANIKDAVDFAITKHGKLDIMFNNAGIAGSQTNFVDIDKAEFEKVINTNLTGSFLGIKHAARAMISARRGSIISTASVCSVLGGVTGCPYTASKHGVVGLVKNAAVELGRYGIRVNAVSPHIVPTPMTKTIFKLNEDEEFSKFYSNLKGSYCEAEDIAGAAVYLGSDESRYVTGHNLMVDGGFSIMNAGFNIFD